VAADPSLAERAAASAAGPSPASAALPLSNKPYWLRQRAAQGERFEYLKGQMGGLKLATVCEEAQCPNIGECWNGGAEGIGTATIMLLGDTCTRGCRFCAVNTSQAPPPPDPLEPEHTAQVGGWRVCVCLYGRGGGATGFFCSRAAAPWPWRLPAKLAAAADMHRLLPRCAAPGLLACPFQPRSRAALPVRAGCGRLGRGVRGADQRGPRRPARRRRRPLCAHRARPEAAQALAAGGVPHPRLQVGWGVENGHEAGGTAPAQQPLLLPCTAALRRPRGLVLRGALHAAPAWRASLQPPALRVVPHCSSTRAHTGSPRLSLPRLQGRPGGRAPPGLQRARRVCPQRGDRGPAAEAGARPPRRLRAEPGGAARRQGRRRLHQVIHHAGPG
jgi:hypothetical protein